MTAAMRRAADGVEAGSDWERRWVARVRYAGQGHELDVLVREGDDGATLAERFAVLHAARNGFTLDTAAEVIGMRHVASGPAHPVRFGPGGEGRRENAPRRGPAVIALRGATLRVADGWRATPHETGGWLLERGA
jgi:N-methylhydantoinase A/oxoprolinase/acetone carboxylase beta subunit